MTGRRRRLAATLSTLLAMGTGGAAGALAYWPNHASEPATSPPSVAVLSARRAPEALRNLVADTRLGSRVDAFAATISPTSCVVINADAATIYAHNRDEPLIPASSLKLTTAAAFLAKVGGTGRFTTTVQGPSPDASGTVHDDIALVGDGDPMLSTAAYVASRKHPPTPATDLGALASKVYAAGVRHVTGDILVLDSRFDAERRVPSWKPVYTSDGDVGPIGALSVDDGFVSYSPRFVAASDPAIAAGDAFRRALAAVGITVDGPTIRRTVKAGHELASIQSAKYSEIVAEMLRESDNNTAESLLKVLAHPHGDGTATRAAGTAARTAALQGLGVAADAVHAIDGSGLDRSDRATCGALLATLTTKPGGFDLEDMLAVAAQTGTLDDRFTTSPLAGRMHAKTGSLDDVTALVGLVDPSAVVKLRFAFISNGAFTDAGGKALQDRLVAALATYPEAPDAAALAP